MKHRGTNLHLAFFCGDPSTETFTVAQVRANDMVEGYYLAGKKMVKAGWPMDQKIVFLGYVA